MNTLCYIVSKMTIISLIHLWIFVNCSRRRKKKPPSTSSSYIEENTKAEQKIERPLWDKEFPKILPPPVHVPEKENKEVDVEPEILEGGLEGPIAKEPSADPRSDMLDPLGNVLFDDPTQLSVDSKESVVGAVKRTSRNPRRSPNVAGGLRLHKTQDTVEHNSSTRTSSSSMRKSVK
ncbi:hypothetical protein V3C99_012794 [Haemonchus contortus]